VEILTQPLTLAEGVLKSMAFAKWKLTAVVLAVSLLTASGLGADRAVAERGREAQAVPPPPSTPDQGESKPAPPPRAWVDQFGDPLPPEALARLGTVRLRHGARADAIAFAPDGRSLASGGIDGVVHVWETATGKELLHIENHRYPGLGLGHVLGLAFAPDGKTLAGARHNQPACLWDVATGKELLPVGKQLPQFGGERERSSWVVFSPDGKTLAYGGGGEVDRPTLRLADANTGEDLRSFGGHKGPVTRVVFSPDGKTLASADDRGIHLHDIASGRARDLLQPDGPAVIFSSLAFSPDGKVLAAASHASKLIRLVEAGTGRVLRTIELTGKRETVSSQRRQAGMAWKQWELRRWSRSEALRHT
jgi:WD40 repeat protein